MVHLLLLVKPYAQKRSTGVANGTLRPRAAAAGAASTTPMECRQRPTQARGRKARARGVHEHLAEVQLHLRAFAALKSEGGHKAYVTCRNLKGQ